MYQPEFIARIPASRTSSFTKTRESGIFFTSRYVDPLSGPRRLKSGLDYSNGFGPIGAINQRHSSRCNRVEKGDQLRPKRFFGWKLELMDRAFHGFDFVVTGEVPVFERFNFVLGKVVIADGGRICPDDRQLAQFSGQMISGFD